MCVSHDARTQTRQTGCTTSLTTVLKEQPLFVQPVVKPGCTIGLTTGLTTGCIHDTTGLTIQPVVKPVVKRLNVCIHDTASCQERQRRVTQRHRPGTRSETGRSSSAMTRYNLW